MLCFFLNIEAQNDKRLDQEIHKIRWLAAGEIDIIECLGSNQTLFIMPCISESFGNTINVKATPLEDVTLAFQFYKLGRSKDALVF